jgi:hypothetical protein
VELLNLPGTPSNVLGFEESTLAEAVKRHVTNYAEMHSLAGYGSIAGYGSQSLQARE